ncbi:MAG: hypothetical protein CMJ59_21200 [Planctomycetaceae bacterium]|nr:hypothetical protein [Planctomycetaceae bacterium]
MRAKIERNADDPSIAGDNAARLSRERFALAMPNKSQAAIVGTALEPRTSLAPKKRSQHHARRIAALEKRLKPRVINRKRTKQEVGGLCQLVVAGGAGNNSSVEGKGSRCENRTHDWFCEGVFRNEIQIASK